MSKPEFATLNCVKTGEWLLKASSMNGVICLVVYNPIFHWSHVKFFDDENSCHNWIEYLLTVSTPN